MEEPRVEEVLDEQNGQVKEQLENKDIDNHNQEEQHESENKETEENENEDDNENGNKSESESEEEIEVVEGREGEENGNVEGKDKSIPLRQFEALVVDAAALIKGKKIHEMGKQLFTTKEIMYETRSQFAREQLALIPTNIQVREPSEESIKQVIEFAKKTGDFPSLSTPDIKLIALACMLQKEFSPEKEIPTTPAAAETNFGNNRNNKAPLTEIAGFYKPKKEDDDDGWITPKNISKLKEPKVNVTEVEEKINLAVITADFAMQNVLMQLKIKIVSMDGLIIKSPRSWVLRCHACMKSTKDMTKQFCPTCGNPTLMKTSVSIDENGVLHYYLKKNYQYNLRGTKFPIPNPKGGKHSNNIILREDQKEYEKAKKGVRKQKTLDLFDPDYVPSFQEGKGSTTHNVTIGYGRTNPNKAKKYSGRRK